MGVLRLWLAFAVLTAHIGAVGNYQLLSGPLAVQAFYVISGFYMALVLDRKYAKSTWVFLFNRVSRLYPGYLALSLLAFLYLYSMGRLTGTDFGALFYINDYWPHFSFWGRAITVASNVLMEGKDVTVFLAVDPHTAGYFLSAHPVHGVVPSSAFQFLPQSWSLGLEFNFYLLSPWLVRLRSRWIVLIMAASTATRLALAHFGYSGDPWTYRFFPSELAVFLLGLMAYRVYRGLGEEDSNWRQASYMATAVLIPVVVLSAYLPGNENSTALLTLPLLALALPWIFERSKDISLDRSIGELSYTVYLSHLLVANLMRPLGVTSGPWASLYVMAGSVALCLAIRHMIEKPADHWRRAMTRKWMK
ncbi:MAG TPA: acyltransferase [bacterium]|jgi:peptidoglycan/LPS O-acetylase OafA/YrhL|nr:acyltransferase [bacterium]